MTDYTLPCNFTTYQNSDYITILDDNIIRAYKDSELVFEFSTTHMNITGASYVKDTLYFTKNHDNHIYSVKNTDNSISTITLNEYTTVELLNHIRETNSIFALNAYGSSCEKIAYNLDEQKTEFLLPIQEIYGDIVLSKNSIGAMLGKDSKDVSVYEDDNDMKYTVLVSYQYKNSKKVEILDTLSVVCTTDSWDDSCYECRVSMHDMKFPLFEQYLYYYPEEQSLSAYGNFVVYYEKDIKGLIISHVANGTVHRIFSLPHDCTNSCEFYFNEKTDILTVVSSKELLRFHIDQDEDMIDKLNAEYNKHYVSKTPVEKFSEMNRLLYTALGNAKCTEVARTRII